MVRSDLYGKYLAIMILFRYFLVVGLMINVFHNAQILYFLLGNFQVRNRKNIK